MRRWSSNEVSTTTCTRGSRRDDATGRLDAVEHRHREVHEDHVGLELLGEPHRLRRRRTPRRRSSRSASRFDQLLETAPDDGVVVDDQDPDHRSGTSTCRSVPLPGAEVHVVWCRRPRARDPRWPGSPKWPAGHSAVGGGGSNPTPSSCTSRIARARGRCATRTTTVRARACAEDVAQSLPARSGRAARRSGRVAARAAPSCRAWP